MPYVLTAADETFVYRTKRNTLLDERVIFDYCLVFVKEGSASVTIDGKTYLCKPGDVYLFRPKVPHATVVTGDVYRQPHVHFSISPYPDREKTFVPFVPLSQIPAESQGLFCEDCLDSYLGIRFPDTFTPKNAQEVEKLFFDVIAEYMRKEPFLKERAMGAALTRLLVTLARELRVSEQGAPAFSKLDTVKNHIELHFAEKLTLDGLAKKFFIGKYYLVSQFTRAFGTSPMKYASRLRVERAEELLKNPNNSVKSVAAALGYENPQVFSHAFKASVGVSPAVYREQSGRS